MIKKLPNIINKLYSISFICLLLFIWWLVCKLQLVPAFMLPSPGKVASALVGDAPALWGHLLISLKEAFIGLFCSIVAAFILAIVMDRFVFLHKSIYPVVVLTQTVPAIVLAPLLVLWLGYGILPKVVLIFITCFFPLVVNILSGFQSVDQDVIKLFQSMGASRWQILWKVKLPYAMESFFAGLRIAVTYAVVGAIIAEWLGGDGGLGVYMTRVRKAYAFDKMFAVIILISFISLALMKLVDLIQKKSMPWKHMKRSMEAADEEHAAGTKDLK